MPASDAGPPQGAQQAHATDRDPVGLKIGIFALSALVLLGIMLLLLGDVPDVGRSTGWRVTFVVMFWSAMRLAGLCASGQPRLFDFFFWLFVFVFLGLAPTVQIRIDEISGTTPGMNPSLDVATGGVVLLGVAAYEVGRLLGRATGGRTDSPEPSTTQAQLRRPGWGLDTRRTFILLGVGVLFTAYFAAKVGLGALLSSRDTSGTAQAALWPNPAVAAIVSALSTFPLLIGAGALAQVRRGFDPRWRGASLALLAGCLLLLLVVVNPISSARYVFGTVAFAVIAFLGAVASTSRARLMMIGTLVGFLFLFPLADAFRRSDEEATFARTGFFAEYAGSADYDGFWQIANALSYWLAGLVQTGQQFLGSILFWVPRSVWPGKPTDTGIVLARFRGYGFENLSAPMWAEGLVNGGPVGVVVMLGVLGLVTAVLDRRLVQGLLSGGRWAMVGAVFPVYMVILLRGSLLQATGGLAIAIACAVFVSARESDVQGSAVDRDEGVRDGFHAHLP